MEALIFHLSSPFSCFVLHLFCHHGIRFLNVQVANQKLVLGVGVGTVALYSVLGILFFPVSAKPWMTFSYTLMVASGFCLFYVQVFNMSETARRIRILTSYLAAPIPAQGEKELPLDGYNSSIMINRRLERLTNMGSLRTKDGRYFAPTGIMLTAARIFRVVNKMFY